MRCHAPQSTRMLSTKSQMQETIAVLAVVFILFILGFSIYSRFFIDAAEDKQESAFEAGAIASAQSAAFLPELQCSNNGVTSNNCVDFIKAMAAASLINNTEHSSYYFEKFGFATLSISEIYPGSAKLILYNKTPESYSHKSAINLPILVFYPLDGNYGFGMANFEAFLK